MGAARWRVRWRSSPRRSDPATSSSGGCLPSSTSRRIAASTRSSRSCGRLASRRLCWTARPRCSGPSWPPWHRSRWAPAASRRRSAPCAVTARSGSWCEPASPRPAGLRTSRASSSTPPASSASWRVLHPGCGARCRRTWPPTVPWSWRRSPARSCAGGRSTASPRRPPRSSGVGCWPRRPPRTAEVALHAGEKVGDYQIRDYIGQGDYGATYRGYASGLSQEVAIVLLDFLTEGPARNRFREEARGLVALRHPNIHPVLDFGEHEGVPYVVQPLVQRATLAERRTGGLMGADAAVRMLRGIGTAVDYAHGQAIVHGDLTPARVLLDANDRPLVTGFGMASLRAGTPAGPGGGDPLYAAPE